MVSRGCRWFELCGQHSCRGAFEVASLLPADETARKSPSTETVRKGLREVPRGRASASAAFRGARLGARGLAPRGRLARRVAPAASQLRAGPRSGIVCGARAKPLGRGLRHVWQNMREHAQPRRRVASGKETWLILPVVICLSQRLSHACLSLSLQSSKLRMAH